VATDESDVERLSLHLQVEAHAAIDTLDVLLCENRTQSAWERDEDICPRFGATGITFGRD